MKYRFEFFNGSWRVYLGIGFITILLLMPWILPAKWFSLFHIQKISLTSYYWVQRHRFFSYVMYLSIGIIAAHMNIPATVALTLLGGYFYGPWLGTLLAVLTVTTGNMLEFYMLRWFFKPLSIQTSHALWQRTRTQLRNHGFWYFLMFELLPFTPTPLITIAAALSPISGLAYLFVQLIGLIPGSYIYASAGARLHTWQTLGDIIPWPLFFILIGLAILTCIPIILKTYGLKKLFWR